ncbi:MAG: prepilin-type N-terminal cleavage/methylation domain-containing protein [Verrucomicrobiia bacterium]
MKTSIQSQELNSLTARVRQRSRGFTLVELMAVMVVIGIVAGITIAGAAYLHERALRMRTKATIHQICTAIDAFKADKGGYPSDFICTTDSGTLKENQYVWPCEALWFWLVYWGPHQQYPRQSYVDLKGDQTTIGNTRINAQYDKSAGNYRRVVDAWSNPLNYKSGNGYSFTDRRNTPRHCPLSYDLCSYGADATTWKDLDKPFDRHQELSLDHGTTIVQGGGQAHAEMPDYFFNPFDTQVSTGGGAKHCFGGEDNNDINNWQQR